MLASSSNFPSFHTIICTLLQLYDGSARLVLVLNAGADEESAIGEQLGVMGCRAPGLRIVGYEVPKRERCVPFRLRRDVGFRGTAG